MPVAKTTANSKQGIRNKITHSVTIAMRMRMTCSHGAGDLELKKCQSLSLSLQEVAVIDSVIHCQVDTVYNH